MRNINQLGRLTILVLLTITVAQSAAQVSSQLEHQASVELVSMPPYWKNSGVPEADWRDHEDWKKTPECKVMMDKLVDIVKAREASGNLTPNEVETLITCMQSPHFDARDMAATAAMVGREEPARSVLRPYLLSLLQDPVSLVRMAAAETLGRLGDAKVIPDLQLLLEDERPLVARVAQRAISKLQHKDTTPDSSKSPKQ